MTKDEFFATITPALLNFLSIAVPAILGYVAYLIRCWVAKATEAKDREALHSALDTGVKAATAKGMKDVPAVVEYAVAYAGKSVPDAMKNLDPPSDVLAKIARSKILTMEKSNA